MLGQSHGAIERADDARDLGGVTEDVGVTLRVRAATPRPCVRLDRASEVRVGGIDLVDGERGLGGPQRRGARCRPLAGAEPVLGHRRGDAARLVGPGLLDGLGGPDVETNLLGREQVGVGDLPEQGMSEPEPAGRASSVSTPARTAAPRAASSSSSGASKTRARSW